MKPKSFFFKILLILAFFVTAGIVTGMALAGMDDPVLSSQESTGVPEGAAEPVPSGVMDTAQELKPEPDEKITINLVGDVLLAAGVGRQAEKHGPDFPWRGSRDVLGIADLTVANLECSVSYRGIREEDKEFTFRADPGLIGPAAGAGVDVFTLANNHVLDFGVEALMDTIDFLDREGIKYTGAGHNREEAFAPVVVDIMGRKIGILAFTRIFPYGRWVAGKNNAGIASAYDEKMVMESILSLDRYCDLVIVTVHWGEETMEHPGREEINLAHRMVDAGADVIAGHHPHVIQGMEMYKGKPIAYSLGNFIFDSASRRAREGLILSLTIEKDRCTSAVVPVITGNGTDILQEREKDAVLDRFHRLSGEIGVYFGEKKAENGGEKD